MNELEGYEQDLMTRGGGAVKPLTWGEKWNATVEATGLTTVGGLDNLRVNAFLDLRQAVQSAYPDQALEEVASARGLNFGPMIPQPGQRVSPRTLMDQNAAVLNSLIETLPEDKRRELAPLQDLDAQAEIKAAEITKRDAEAAAQTYGLSGHAWAFLASAWGVMSDPVNLSAMAVTAPFGGPLTAVGRQALTAGLTQIPISVEVQRRRRELGLEAGFQPAAVEVGMAAGTAGAISLVAKGGAAAFGFLSRAATRAPAVRGIPSPEPRVEAPPGAPAAPTAPAPPARAPEEQLPLFTPPPERPPAAPPERPPVTAEQVAAAELLHERDRIILDAPARPQTIAGKELHERQVVEAASALEQARPPDVRVSSVTDGAPPRVDPGTAGGRVTIEAAADATTGPVPFAPKFAGRIAQFFENARQDLIRPTGDRMTVRAMMVELGDLVASHDLEGRPNPAYPVKELQPRDRSAMASRLFVREKAAQLEPELLGDSPTAGTGSPVIGPDGIVESGNGRVLLLQQAYAEHPDRIAAYQQFLRDKGYDLTGFKQPVLIRMREGELTLAERARLALEANISPTAGLSPRERAFADAKFLDDVMLSRHAGGDVTLARNQGFARAFADQVVAPEERPNFMTADNTLSAEGARRVEAALVARAYGADDVITGLYEATDATSKSILGGLADAAPTVARLKLAIEGGLQVEDPTPAMLEAYRQVDAARRAGFKIGEVIYQADLERGAVPENVIAATRLYFRNAEMTQPAGRDTIAERIESTANRLMNQANALGDLFGDTPPTATASLQSAVLAGTNLSHLEVGGAGRELVREAVKNKWTREQISNLEQVKAAQAQAESFPRTDQAEGYLSDAWKRNRQFNFELEGEPGGTKRFETVTGYDNGIVRLEGVAMKYAEGNLKAERTAWIVTGPPAAGKSGFAEEIARKMGAAIVDSDDAKKVLPEFRGGIGASAVHEESTELAGLVQRQLMDRGENIILPRVGNNADKMVKAIELLQAKGYKVNVAHVFVEENEAYRRMISRWLDSQRLIDARYVEEVDGNTPKAYISIKERASLNDWAEIDATGPRGAHILTDGDGELAQLLDSSLRPKGEAPGAGPGRGGIPQRGEGAAGYGAAPAGGRAPAEGPPVEPTPEQIEAVRRNAGSEKALQYLAEARARREAREAIGDKVLAADAERALEEAGGDLPDVVIPQPDGSEVRMSARQALKEAEADATAHDEFLNCVGTTLEGA